MAEPAKKISSATEAEIELTLVKKPAEKKDNIVDFNQYRRDLNKQKISDKKKQNAAPDELDQKANPAETENGKKESPAQTPASADQKKTIPEKSKSAPLAESTEKEKAEQARQGAPMEGVSESAGLTGGTGTQDQDKAKEAKTPGQQPAGAPPQAQTPAKPPAESGEEEGEQEPQNTFQRTRQRIDEQKKNVSFSQDKADKAREKYDKDKEQKSWKRALSGRQLKKREKEANKEKKKLEKLEKLQAIQTASGNILKQSWINLIDSWGLTYFYIAFHFLMAYFTPFANLFCKFGEEWLPKQVKAQNPEAAKVISKKAELVEVAGCVLIGLLLFFIIMGIITLISIIGYAYMHPLKTLYEIGPGIAWEVIKCAISSCAE